MSHRTQAPALRREADERAFAAVKLEIKQCFVTHVMYYGGVEPVFNRVRPNREEAKVFVDDHIDELWAKVPIPDDLRTKYERLEDRLNPTRPRRGRRRKDEPKRNQLTCNALDTWHKRNGDRISNHQPASTKELAKLAGISTASVSRFFEEKFPGRGNRGYTAELRRGRFGVLLARWQDDLGRAWGTQGDLDSIAVDGEGHRARLPARPVKPRAGHSEYLDDALDQE
jgi:hypothetical protein